MEGAELERWNIDFDVSKSMRYHAYRRDFWDRLDIASKILTGISGGGVLLTIIRSSTTLATLFAVVVAASSLVDVVMRYARRARRHDGLYRDFALLEEAIIAKEKPNMADVTKWRSRRIAIEAKEPGVLDLLERRCAAEECIARGVAINPEWQLNWVQVLIAQYWFLSVPRSFKQKKSD